MVLVVTHGRASDSYSFTENTHGIVRQPTTPRRPPPLPLSRRITPIFELKRERIFQRRVRRCWKILVLRARDWDAVDRYAPSVTTRCDEDGASKAIVTIVAANQARPVLPGNVGQRADPNIPASRFGWKDRRWVRDKYCGRRFKDRGRRKIGCVSRSER